MSNNKLFSCLYNGGLGLYTLAFLPKLLKQKEKYKKILENKWGRGFDGITGKPLIWIHAVSVGETKAIASLANQIKKEHPEAKFLVTSVTETGHMEAKKTLAFADYFLFLPFDFSWIIDPIVKKLKPDLVLLSEGDYWYHFVNAAKKYGAHVAIVNGKLSERSMQRYQYLGPFLKDFFAPVDLFCLQSNHYAERFQMLGVDHKKIAVLGNLKLDAPIKHLSAEELKNWQNKFHLKPEDLVIVAGSTHAPEEELLLNTYKQLSVEFPTLKLILVPRHPERFETVKNIIANTQIPFTQFSKLDQAQGNEKIILIDAMGQLNTCYQLATLAIVCGSFTPKVGGHNILEPCVFGKPTLFGRYMHTQKDFLNLALEHQAGLQVTADQLALTLSKLLKNPTERADLGRRGLKLIQETQGASKRTFDLIEDKLQLSTRLRLPKNKSLS